MKLKSVVLLSLAFVSILANANSIDSLRNEIIHCVSKYDAKVVARDIADIIEKHRSLERKDI